ncbi:hypothetical protein ACGF7U_16340 [Micromonospora sp. NPDC047670]
MRHVEIRRVRCRPLVRTVIAEVARGPAPGGAAGLATLVGPTR